MHAQNEWNGGSERWKGKNEKKKTIIKSSIMILPVSVNCCALSNCCALLKKKEAQQLDLVFIFE
jgi:hypothetical protein